MADDPQERICRFDPGGGHLAVRLTANNALHAAGRFGVWDAGAKLLEQWTMVVGVAGFADYTVGTPPAQLAEGSLTWALVVCSHDQNIDQGSVALVVNQDGKACPTDPPARYPLKQVPACQSGKAIPISDELQFRAR